MEFLEESENGVAFPFYPHALEDCFKSEFSGLMGEKAGNPEVSSLSIPPSASKGSLSLPKPVFNPSQQLLTGKILVESLVKALGLSLEVFYLFLAVDASELVADDGFL